MLQQFTWQNYFTLIGTLLIFYYGYVCLKWYRKEIRAAIKGDKSQNSLLPVAFTLPPDNEVIGTAKPVHGAAISGEELRFGPPDEPEHYQENNLILKEDSELVGAFSDMIAEIKTLVRVIADSNDSRENFEMLFHLEVQKFEILAGTPYQEKINQFLIKESSGQFPFKLQPDELDTYWQNIQV